jgi:hypothetical protein
LGFFINLKIEFYESSNRIKDDFVIGHAALPKMGRVITGLTPRVPKPSAGYFSKLQSSISPGRESARKQFQKSQTPRVPRLHLEKIQTESESEYSQYSDSEYTYTGKYKFWGCGGSPRVPRLHLEKIQTKSENK